MGGSERFTGGSERLQYARVHGSCVVAERQQLGAEGITKQMRFVLEQPLDEIDVGATVDVAHGLRDLL